MKFWFRNIQHIWEHYKSCIKNVDQWMKYVRMYFVFIKQGLKDSILNLKIIHVHVYFYTWMSYKMLNFMKNWSQTFITLWYLLSLWMIILWNINKRTLYSIGVFRKNILCLWTGNRFILEILYVKSH